MTAQEAQRAFEEAASAAEAVGAHPGYAGLLGRYGAVAYGWGAAVASVGGDPVAELERLLGPRPYDRTLRAVTAARFPRSDPPSAAPTDPGRPSASAPDTIPFSRPPSARDLFEDEEDSQP